MEPKDIKTMDDLFRAILAILPNAILDEIDGEIVICTGLCTPDGVDLLTIPQHIEDTDHD